ncbi:MAG: efflux RND transporter periplasmic adaptor subunit [Treponemataceae bacterium]|nr:MAG: efflux RND transporter periplasmic adaptor subunit [Treponemataceae bacterium]
MAKRTKKFMVVVTTIGIAAALVFVPVLLAQDGKAASETEADKAPVYSVKTAEAEERTLEAYLEINGDVVSGTRLEVLSETAGKLVMVKAALGSRVRKGELIAQIDPSSIGNRYMLNSVYAPISGIVCASPLAAGTTVQTGSAIVVIAETDDLRIEALVPEREVSQLRVGLTAAVTLPAFAGEVFSAHVTQVSPILDAASRTKKIVLRFDDAGVNGIDAGMFAHIKLGTRIYPDVVTVPSVAIVEKIAEKSATIDGGGQYVYLLSANNTVRLSHVTVGASVDNITEIKSGLVPGETVIVQGQQFLFDGAAVVVRK